MITSNPVLTLALAFAFFVVALVLFLAALYVFRSAGSDDSRTPYEKLVGWLDENEIEYEFYQLDAYNSYLISFPAGDGSGYAYEFEFSKVDGRLVDYGMDY